MNREDFISRPNLAKFYQISPGTLGVWKTEERYDLPCELVGNTVYYAWKNVYRFMSFDEEDYKLLMKLRDRTHLLNIKNAALYADCSISTLRAAANLEVPIRPRYVGRVVRYRRAELDIYRKWRKKRRDTFIESRMNPFLFI